MIYDTKYEALNAFFSELASELLSGPAFPTTSDNFAGTYLGTHVIDSLPGYITYYCPITPFSGSDSGTTAGEVNVWLRTSSEAAINRVATAISYAIGYGGVLLRYSGGALWIRRGDPLIVPISVPDDPGILRRLINIEIEDLGAAIPPQPGPM